MSSSVPANDRASASAGRCRPRRATSTAPRMAMLEMAAWRSAATSARRTAFQRGQLQPGQDLLVAFAQGQGEGGCAVRTAAQPFGSEPQPARQPITGEAPWRRRQQQAGDDGRSGRDGHQQPRIQQHAGAGLADRHAAHLVQPEADNHRQDGADGPQLAGRGQEQEARRQQRHGRDAQDGIVDAGGGDQQDHAQDHRDQQQHHGGQDGAEHAVRADQEEGDVDRQRRFRRAVGAGDQRGQRADDGQAQRHLAASGERRQQPRQIAGRGKPGLRQTGPWRISTTALAPMRTSCAGGSSSSTRTGKRCATRSSPSAAPAAANAAG